MAQFLRATRLLPVVALILALGVAVYGAQKDSDDRKPSLSLKATPVAGFAPLRVRVTADVRGGADDFQDLYCASVEWEWGDDLRSGNSEDCSPYEAGKSEIRRRYSAEHLFRYPGTYKLTLRLKQKERVVALGSATIEVRPGLRDSFDN
jgi:hypothetical protein